MPIELKNASYEYKMEDSVCKAVKNVSLTIDDGTFVCICGENGSGKSTLAKMLNGLLIPVTGDVFVDGVSTRTESEDEAFKIRQKVGMVFQNPDNQMVASIIEDEIAFGPENLGIPREEIEERITNALAAVEMTEYRHHTPEKLSGGQKQRIAIASMLAMKPQVLVLDESTAMLDPAGRKEVMKVAEDLHNQGITIVLITHFMEECTRAERVIVMNKGNVVMDGTPADIFSDYDRVCKYNLELPAVDGIAKALREAGLDLPQKVYTEKALAEEICQLK